MSEFRCKYEYSKPYGRPRHVWSCVCSIGGVHLSVNDRGEDCEHGDRYSGGFEVHYRFPPEYMAKDPPSYHSCDVIGGPCWHDGSSSYAHDHLIPFWLAAPTDHERMFEMLKNDVEDRFFGENATPLAMGMLSAFTSRG